MAASATRKQCCHSLKKDAPAKTQDAADDEYTNENEEGNHAGSI
jgi:hypothetical protein